MLKRGTKKVLNRATLAWRMGAVTVRHSDSAMGAFYRRMRTRHGVPQAVTATAHQLARIGSFMLKHHTPYDDPGANDYEEKYRPRAIRHLDRRAQQLGLQLTLVQPAS